MNVAGRLRQFLTELIGGAMDGAAEPHHVVGRCRLLLLDTIASLLESGLRRVGSCCAGLFAELRHVIPGSGAGLRRRSAALVGLFHNALSAEGRIGDAYSRLACSRLELTSCGDLRSPTADCCERESRPATGVVRAQGELFNSPLVFASET